MIEFAMPFPPSVNRYWRHPTTGRLAGRHLISEEGRRFRAMVKDLAWANSLPCLSGSLIVVIRAYPPDKRRRDLDNLCKATLDGLVHAAVIEDDGLIDDLRIVRAGQVAGGRLVVTITVVGANA